MKKLDLKSCESFQSLPPRKKLFVLEYLKDFNGTQAAIRAKYSRKGADVQATRLLANASVKAAVKELSEQLQDNTIMTIEELRQFWSLIARGDITDIAAWNEDGHTFTKNSNEMDPSKTRLIRRIKTTERVSAKGDFTDVKTEIELHDPLKASELLGMTYGIFKEKIEHSGVVKYVPEIVDYSTAVKKKE